MAPRSRISRRCRPRPPGHPRPRPGRRSRPRRDAAEPSSARGRRRRRAPHRPSRHSRRRRVRRCPRRRHPRPALSPAGVDPLLGSDGRLTLLLMGTDYRPAHPGNRTDAMMVVSIDPTTGKSAGFSVPRDISDFPLPKSGKYGPKVNGLYQHLDATMGNGGKGMKQAFARAFDIEIDHYVLIGFTGVMKLVQASAASTSRSQSPTTTRTTGSTAAHRGWGLPAGKSHLNAEDALIFARSRKGDSDFQRAKRQQQLVMAAVAKVRKRGIDDLRQAAQHRQGDGPDGPATEPCCRPVRALQHGRPGQGRSGGLRAEEVRGPQRRHRLQAGPRPVQEVDREPFPARAAVRDVDRVHA